MARRKPKPQDPRPMVGFRLTEEDRERLRARAKEEGLTLQALFEREMLGHENAQPREAWGHTVPRQKERLALPASA